GRAERRPDRRRASPPAPCRGEAAGSPTGRCRRKLAARASCTRTPRRARRRPRAAGGSPRSARELLQDRRGEETRQAREDVERGLLLAACRQQPGLPAAHLCVVLEQEPEEHVDPWILVRDRVRLAQVGGLLRPRDAERLVLRPRLVAVLADPEVLRTV